MVATKWLTPFLIQNELPPTQSKAHSMCRPNRPNGTRSVLTIFPPPHPIEIPAPTGASTTMHWYNPSGVSSTSTMSSQNK